MFRAFTINALLLLALAGVAAAGLLGRADPAYAESPVNVARNANGTGYPEITASYTCGCDNPWSAINGIYSFNDSPRDRWTNYGSPNTEDWLAVDFGTDQVFNQVKLYVYNDGGGVKTPAGFQLQYWDNGQWRDVVNSIATPSAPYAEINAQATTSNTVNVIDFDEVTSRKLQVKFTNPPGAYSGIVELEVYLSLTPDATAAAAVTSLLQSLPTGTAVALTDKTAIVAARTAYDQLTAPQKQLVTNLNRLLEAEAGLGALEAALTEAGARLAFGNAQGTAITLRLRSVVDAIYGIDGGLFQVTAGGAPLAVTEAVYDTRDAGEKTIMLSLAAPGLGSETNVELMVAPAAFKTKNGGWNKEISAFPVVAFSRLDPTHDQTVGIDDMALLASQASLRIDVNHDGSFDRDDVAALLGAIAARLP